MTVARADRQRHRALAPTGRRCTVEMAIPGRSEFSDIHEF